MFILFLFCRNLQPDHRQTFSTMIIYQIFTRLYGNPTTSNVPNGTLEENGAAKMNGFTTDVLKRIKDFGFSHVWFTGLIEHATQTDYSRYGIAQDHPWVVKGKAGSPYAIKDYYDIDPDLAERVEDRMQEFEELVVRTHKAGLKMIIDFVPNHVARQYHSDAAPKGTEDLGMGDDSQLHFSTDNNFYYCWGEPLHTDNFASKGVEFPYLEHPAKATGNDQFAAWPGRNDWYETIKLNYGIDYCGGGSKHFAPTPSTWHKMVNILLFWASKGVDAFRCDMVEMVPVEFWHYAIAKVKRAYPHIDFIAEVYNPDLYRSYIHEGGFDYLYDKVGLYDTLRAVVCRQSAAASITHAWQATDDIKNHMLYFLENHDEQRIASDFFCGNPTEALPALVTVTFMGTNPVMIYAGQELGERGMDEEGFSGRDGRTTIFDYWSPESLRKLAQLPSPKARSKKLATKDILTPTERELYDYYHHILTLRTTHPAFIYGLFYDLMYVNYDGSEGFNPGRHYAFLRRSEDEIILVVANFSDQEAAMGVRIPTHAYDFLSLPEGTFPVKDVISKERLKLTFVRDGYSKVHVPANGAVALSYRLK